MHFGSYFAQNFSSVFVECAQKIIAKKRFFVRYYKILCFLVIQCTLCCVLRGYPYHPNGGIVLYAGVSPYPNKTHSRSVECAVDTKADKIVDKNISTFYPPSTSGLKGSCFGYRGYTCIFSTFSEFG